LFSTVELLLFDVNQESLTQPHIRKLRNIITEDIALMEDVVLLKATG